MDPDIRALLGRIYESGRRHDESERIHSRRFLNLEPDTAQLVSALARAARRRRILEIGTSNGYSTIWLAWSASCVGGRVISIERDAAKQALAAENLAQARLSPVVDLRLGEATQLVAALDGPFDMVFFDADRRSAPDQVELLTPKLATDVLLLADNAISHPAEIAPYIAAIEVLPDFDHLVVPIGKGLSLAYRGPFPPASLRSP